jgi:hypothetical protein
MEKVVVAAVILAYGAVVIWPAARICRRAGYSPWLAIAAVVPLANLLLLWFIALSPWTTDQTEDSAEHPRPSWRAVLSIFRSLRERIRLIGLPQSP